MAVTPKGVRMINNNVVQNGMALIMTSRDAMDWNHIPDGSLYVNPKTGVMMTKIEGESDWVPAGLKNDGTLVISRDTSLQIEIFTVKTLDNRDGTFTYTNAAGEQRYKSNEKGLVFELENGTYMPGRNHLTVIFDDVLERSAASGGIEELDEKRFRITEPVPVGTEITVKYIKWVKIGNPYPRWYEAYNEPTSAEVGDFFLDLDATVEGELGEVGETDDIPASGNISWSRIIGTPTSIKGYGIKDNISYAGHMHSTNDISGLDDYVAVRANNATNVLQTKLANGTITVSKATTATNATNATNAATATRATTATKADTATTAISAQKIVVSNTTYNVDTTKAGGAKAANKIAVYDANGKIPAAALPKIESFVKGMIIDWFGSSRQVPDGWAICDGRKVNGIQTPNLVGKFILCGGESGTYTASTSVNALKTGGNKNHIASITIQQKNLPSHKHKLSGKCTIKVPQHYHTYGHQTSNNNGYFFIKDGGGNTSLGSPTLPSGVKPWFWNGSGGDNFQPARWGDNLATSYPLGDNGTYNQQCEIVDFNSDSVGSGTALSINTAPEYVALFKIMYVGA